MKNIFNNLGFVTKQNIIGMTVGAVVVVSGLVIMNMSSAPKQSANKAAFNAYENSVPSYGADASETAAIPGLSGQENGEPQAPLMGAGPDEVAASAGAQGGAYKGSAAAQAAGETMANAGLSPFDEGAKAAQGAPFNADGGENAAADAMQNAASSALDSKTAAQAASSPSAAQAVAAKLRTEKGQLSTGPQIAGGRSGSVSGGMSSSRATSGGADTSAKEIPQNAAQNLNNANTNMTASAHGRAGSLGGYGVKAGEGVANTGGKTQQLYTVNELVVAAKLSSQGKRQAVANNTSKGLALAQAAFDGSSGETGGIEVTGGVETGKTGEALARTANNLNLTPAQPKFNDAETEVQEQQDIKGKLIGKLFLMTLIMGVAMFACSKLSQGGVYGKAAAFILGAIAILALTRLAFWGNNNAFELTRQMDSAKYTQSSGKGWRTGISIGFTIMSALIIISCIGSVVKNFKEGFSAGKNGAKLGNPSFFAKVGKVFGYIAKYAGKALKWIGVGKGVASAAKSTTGKTR